MNLGIALQRLGERGAPGALERAVAAYELALTVQSPETDPAAWALTQMNLGNGLRNLGERGVPGALDRAVAAYEAALTVTTREGDTVGWARVQGNLAFAYLALNRIADARAAMERAEAAFEQWGTRSVWSARRSSWRSCPQNSGSLPGCTQPPGSQRVSLVLSPAP